MSFMAEEDGLVLSQKETILWLHNPRTMLLY